MDMRVLCECQTSSLIVLQSYFYSVTNAVQARSAYTLWFMLCGWLRLRAVQSENLCKYSVQATNIHSEDLPILTRTPSFIDADMDVGPFALTQLNPCSK